MAMKLLVNVLWGEIAGASAAQPGPARAAEQRRRGLRDLVVRRDGYAPWGLSNAAPAGAAQAPRREPVADPLWADTQPWCHE